MKEIHFGSDNSFLAKYKEGYLCIICYGGTGFAIKVDEALTEEKLKLIMSFDEKNVMIYCRRKGWDFYDYYDEKLFNYNEKDEYVFVKQFEKIKAVKQWPY